MRSGAKIVADRLGGSEQRDGFRSSLCNAFASGGRRKVSWWCGARWASPARRVKTAGWMRLRSNERRAACACPGLDRRGRMGEPARTPREGDTKRGQRSLLSGKESASLRSPPHRTVHTASTVHGSSKPHCVPCIRSFPRTCSLARAMELLMAVEMYQDQVAFGVRSPHPSRFSMMDMQFFVVEE